MCRAKFRPAHACAVHDLNPGYFRRDRSVFKCRISSPSTYQFVAMSRQFSKITYVTDGCMIPKKVEVYMGNPEFLKKVPDADEKYKTVVQGKQVKFTSVCINGQCTDIMRSTYMDETARCLHVFANSGLRAYGVDAKNPYYGLDVSNTANEAWVGFFWHCRVMMKESGATSCRVHHVYPASGIVTPGVPHPEVLLVKDVPVYYAPGLPVPVATTELYVDETTYGKFIGQSACFSNMVKYSHDFDLFWFLLGNGGDKTASSPEHVLQMIKGFNACKACNLPDPAKCEELVRKNQEKYDAAGFARPGAVQFRDQALYYNDLVFKKMPMLTPKDCKKMAAMLIMSGDCPFFRDTKGAVNVGIDHPECAGNLLVMLVMILAGLHFYDPVSKDWMYINQLSVKKLERMHQNKLVPVEAMCFGALEEADKAVTYPHPKQADLTWGSCKYNPNSTPFFECNGGNPGFFEKGYELIVKAMGEEQAPECVEARVRLNLPPNTPFNISDGVEVRACLLRLSKAIVRKYGMGA